MPKIPYPKEFPPAGFDVVCTVGRVVFTGDEDPRTVAFGIIGSHGVEGHYTFPNEDGGTVNVIVEHTPQEQAMSDDR